MRTSALFGAKIIEFFEICGVSARTRRGVEPVRTFFEQGGKGINFFTILCEHFLWMAPNKLVLLFLKFMFSIYDYALFNL